MVEAALATRSVYQRNAFKLVGRGHFETSAAEMRRAILMDELAKDENLCEMLSGRLNQVSAGSLRGVTAEQKVLAVADYEKSHALFDASALIREAFADGWAAREEAK